MKWLYRIFRLFKCPHRYEHVSKIMEHLETVKEAPHAYVYVSRCRRCGKLRKFRT